MLIPVSNSELEKVDAADLLLGLITRKQTPITSPLPVSAVLHPKAGNCTHSCQLSLTPPVPLCH